MRRVGHLMPLIAEYDNLQLAFIKSCRGKFSKREVVEFRADYERNISEMRRSLLSGDVEVGDYHYFKIYDPKERLICAAPFRERVLHHAIMNVCHEYFDRTLIDDTYATRRGKGVYAALDKAVAGASRYTHVVKLDYRKYYDSIDHATLKTKLSRLFKDDDLLRLFGDIIDSYCVTHGRGLPIGNLTSQYFANYYLSSLDHALKENLRVPVYIRYMDDVLMMDNDRVRLRDAVAFMRDYSTEELSLTLKSPIYRRTVTGVPFLGYVVKPHYLTLSGRSKKRFRTKLLDATKRYNARLWGEKEYQEHLLPLLAFVTHARCRGLRDTVIKGVGQPTTVPIA